VRNAKSRLTRRIVLGGIGGAAGVLAAPALVRAQGKPKEIAIGALCSLSGAAAAFGTSAKNAIEVGAEAVNKAGGIWRNGTGMIKLAIADDQSKPEIAASEFARFAREKATVAVISLISSPAMIQATIEAERQRLIMVNTGSAAKDINERGLKYTFSTCNNTDGTVRSYLEFTREIVEKSGQIPKTPAIIYENKFSGPSYRKAWHELYPGIIKWAPSGDYPYDPTTADFAPLVARLKADGVDFPVLSSYPQDTILLVRAMLEQNYKPLAISGFYGALANIEVVEALGKGADYIMGQAPYLYDMNVAGSREFVDAYKQKVGKLPDPLAGLSYNGFSGLAAAIRHATNPTDRDSVRETMAKLDIPVSQESVVIPDGIKINEKGANPIASGGYYQIRDGVHRAVLPVKFATEKPVYPKP
jgi:branched-chain amino acid transport system substrate-binding protein